jgi:two-component system sensor histidine kinase UhpB
METALYRIVQESLTNVARHAHAQKTCILLKEDGQRVALTISDDGSGFDQSQLQKVPGPGQERGWGLVGMYERAHLLDGTLSIDSAPGRGTTVQGFIPLPTSSSGKKTTVQEVASAERE